MPDKWQLFPSQRQPFSLSLSVFLQLGCAFSATILHAQGCAVIIHSTSLSPLLSKPNNNSSLAGTENEREGVGGRERNTMPNKLSNEAHFVVFRQEAEAAVAGKFFLSPLAVKENYAHFILLTFS